MTAFPEDRVCGAGLLVIDGANVVGSRPDGWWRDRPAAAARLYARLAAVTGDPASFAARMAPLVSPRGPWQVVLVLEGRARAGVPASPSAAGTLVVHHAAGPGDDAIVDLLSAERRLSNHPPGAGGAADVSRWLGVVTADRELGRRAGALRAEVVRPAALWRALAETTSP